jgi:hypothetical protein
MALRVEWELRFQPYEPNAKRFGYQFREFDFHAAYKIIDTPSPEARKNMTFFDMTLYTHPPHVVERIMKARNTIADILCQEFRKSIMETLAQHDTIDGYKPDAKSPT